MVSGTGDARRRPRAVGAASAGGRLTGATGDTRSTTEWEVAEIREDLPFTGPP